MSVRFLVRAVCLEIGFVGWSAPTLVTGFHSQITPYRLSGLSMTMVALSGLMTAHTFAYDEAIALEQETINDFRNNYGLLYPDMRTFVSELTTKTKGDAPRELSYALDILDILPPDSPHLSASSFDKEFVMERGPIALDMTDLLVSNVARYVRDEEQGWLTDRGSLITVWTGLLKINLSNVQHGVTQNPDLEYLEAGIGGLNVKFETAPPVNVEHLRALLKVLVDEG